MAEMAPLDSCAPAIHPTRDPFSSRWQLPPFPGPRQKAQLPNQQRLLHSLVRNESFYQCHRYQRTSQILHKKLVCRPTPFDTDVSTTWYVMNFDNSDETGGFVFRSLVIPICLTIHAQGSYTTCTRFVHNRNTHVHPTKIRVPAGIPQ
jgi:hypothetical protein